MAQYPTKSPDYEKNLAEGKTCLLMYSGGVDTSICVYLLQHYYGYKVITLTIDVHHDAEDMQAMVEKAKTLGAIKTIIYDGKKDIIEKFGAQIIQANGLYDDKYPIGTSVARPVQAKIAVDIALEEGVDAIAHGCKGRGADAFRLNMVFKSLMPDTMKLVLPIGDRWPTRQQEVDFAYENNIPVPVPQDNPFSYDDCTLSNAINYGLIDDTTQEAPELCFKRTKHVSEAPDQKEDVAILFKNGLPTHINGKEVSIYEAIKTLNTIGGKHGVGRIDMVENGLYGNKFRWVYEAPGMLMLITAHKEIEKICLPQSTLFYKHNFVDPQRALQAYKSYLYSPLIKGLGAFIDSTQEYVEGEIILSLYKGKVTIKSRKSEGSLVNGDPKDVCPQEKMNTVPYGFEEYLMVSKHPGIMKETLGEEISEEAKTQSIGFKPIEKMTKVAK